MERDLDDTFEPVLFDGHDLGVLQVFSEQHTKVGRDGVRLFIGRRKTDAGGGGVRADDEFDRRFSGVYNKGKFVFAHLRDTVDLPADEKAVKLLRKSADMESVLGHCNSLTWAKRQKATIFAPSCAENKKSFLKL